MFLIISIYDYTCLCNDGVGEGVIGEISIVSSSL